MRHVPDESLSRVSAYDWFGSLAFQPLGLAIWGPIAELIGISPALWLAAVLGLRRRSWLARARDPQHARASAGVGQRDGPAREGLRAHELQVHGAAEQREAVSERDRVDVEPVLVDELEAREPLREAGTAVGEDRAAVLCFEAFDLGLSSPR